MVRTILLTFFATAALGTLGVAFFGNRPAASAPAGGSTPATTTPARSTPATSGPDCVGCSLTAP